MPRSRSDSVAAPFCWALLGLLLAAGAPVSSQESERRPELPDGADPNSARAYYDVAVESLERDPRRAVEYFRWAARLQPDWAEPLEGWRTAMLLTEPRELAQYMLFGRRSAVGVLADSLRHAASLKAPLQFRPFEEHLVQGLVRSMARDFDPLDVFDDIQLEYEVENLVRDMGPSVRALFAYANHDIDLALDLYGTVVQRADSTTRGYWISERAHLMAIAGRYEEARIEYDSALAALRKTDEEELVIFYLSKADQLHSMGLMAEVLGDPAQARRDYDQALEEDLSYHPAHEGLARLSLAAGDTADAEFRYRMAVDLAPYEPALRMKLAGILALGGDASGARAEAEEAVKSNPHFAAPHVVMGALAERTGDAEQAVTHYEQFLNLAPRYDRTRASVQNRLAALQAGGRERDR